MMGGHFYGGALELEGAGMNAANLNRNGNESLWRGI